MEVLSAPKQVDFVDAWYDVAGEDHFWLRWRFHYLLGELRRLGLDPSKPLAGLDIGCGHGMVQRQLRHHTAWRADGCDLNTMALSMHSGDAGRTLYYDVNDRRAEFKAAYDFIILFDVIEHIDDTKRFIESATHHLKPGGYAFINVPACQAIYSRYDAVQGHCRRYDRPTLRRHLEEGGLDVVSMRYWGFFMLPVALLRKFYVNHLDTADEVMKTGFAPPSPLASHLLSGALALESMLPAPPLGTSLLAVARRPG